MRAFSDQPVEHSKIEAVLEAARLAPSARNRQEWRLVVVTGEETRKQLMHAAGNQPFVGEAPVVIVCCAETAREKMTCGLESYPIDVAIAIDHMTLAAVELGLGTCWIGKFDPSAVREICGIPREIEVVELLPLGYPKDPQVTEKPRLALDEIVRWERW